MSGGRRPMAVNLASGGKHWTKTEIEARQAAEVRVEKPVKLVCPKWLSPAAAKLFRGYAKDLLDSGLPVSKLDTGTLARLCDAEWSYAEASRHKAAYLTIAREVLEQEAAAREAGTVAEGPDRMEAYALAQEQIAYWTKTAASCEKIARGAANDLGCTIASRCRMVVPKLDTGDEDDPLLTLLERRNA